MFRRTGTEAEAYANMAFVYAQRGDLEKAKASYSRALDLDQKMKPAAEALVQIAQYEQFLQPRPDSRPLPRADAQIAGEVLSPTEPEAEITWPEMPQTVGPLVPFPADNTSMGSVEVSDSAQPVSFEQDGGANVPGGFVPTAAPGISKSNVDFAAGLGDLVSQSAN